MKIFVQITQFNAVLRERPCHTMSQSCANHFILLVSLETLTDYLRAHCDVFLFVSCTE